MRNKLQGTIAVTIYTKTYTRRHTSSVIVVVPVQCTDSVQLLHAQDLNKQSTVRKNEACYSDELDFPEKWRENIGQIPNMK